MSGAAVIIEDHYKRILILLRGPTAPWMPCKWDLPGGGIEPGETPEDAAIREAYEETGLRVKSLTFLERAHGRSGYLYMYKADKWTGKVKLDYEHIDYAWLTLDEALQWDLIPLQKAMLLNY